MIRCRTAFAIATAAVFAAAPAAHADYLGVTQAYCGNGPLLIEGGQFYLMAFASSEGVR